MKSRRNNFKRITFVYLKFNTGIISSTMNQKNKQR